ncbi:scavenger receptor cysteine-rich type 1 protein M130-like [Carassius gibelio]|uniref:scavenger receptor cysteine-rich type 1 protein M130-like n=1 Tax=Carassius gibelio TaxID=101364 RepID=UPI0022797BB6|nr:scavenger receptor cysteine-rich type 1 protein M130-like [Carassius gibelio]
MTKRQYVTNRVDTPENYDDVIINGQYSQGAKEGDQEEYDDVWSITEDVKTLLGGDGALVGDTVGDSIITWSPGGGGVFCAVVLFCASKQMKKAFSSFSGEMVLSQVRGQFLLEETRLGEAAVMAQKAAELDSSEFDVVFSAAHMLSSSPLLGWGKYGCDHSKDAGVICSGVRLVGGSRCSGRLQILHNQTWMSVCDAVFDQQDAEVVCRELDCGAPVQVLGAAAFDKGDAQMWTQEIQCRGNEYQIHLCPASLSHENNYSHHNDVRLVCADSVNVRLVGGHSRCAGRVEVFHRGQWGTVCDDSWDMADAAVVCRELDCGTAVIATLNAHFGQGSGPIWMDDVAFSGSESTLKNCRSGSWGVNDCTNGEDAGVICSGKLFPDRVNVRLVNGDSHCAGRVEVLHDGQWGTVCDDDWDMTDAAVVCREMSCGEALQAPQYSFFGRGSGKIWMNEVQCKGSESTLKECGSKGWGERNTVLLWPS